MLLSDLHLGKAGHFRKHGIPISKQVHLTDLAILDHLIDQLQPERVVLLGDLFHSEENREWLDFKNFLLGHSTINFVLVQGNHDILAEYPGEITVVPKLEEPPFSFSHIREEDDFYNISGHIHPGVSIRGRARQGITTPCFLFSKTHAILPAFGQFTGIMKIRPQKEDRVFAIADKTVIELR